MTTTTKTAKTRCLRLVAAVCGLLLTSTASSGRVCRVHATHPIWSPDGNRIAYLSDLTGGYEIYLLDLATGFQTRVTRNPGFEGQVSWVPGGSEIVFWGMFPGDESFDVYRLDLRTARLVKVIESADYHEFDVAVAPSGRRLAYAREGNEGKSLFVLDLASGRTHRVTSGAAPEHTPDWAPDGERLAFSAGPLPESDLFVLDRAGSSPRPLEGPEAGGAYFPKWSPDGTRLLYTAIVRPEEEYEIHLVEGDGTSDRVLALGADSGPASWSPNGKRFAWTHRLDEGSEILLQDLEKGTTELIVPCEGPER